MAAFVLGTAALGLPYGFSPTGERSLLPAQEARAVLQAAAACDWLAADTAPAYGVSEERVGEGWSGPVWTKVIRAELLTMKASVENSLRALKRPEVALLQWHNWSAPLAEDRDFIALWSWLRDHVGVVSLGATTYGPVDAAAAACSGLFEWVQLEANVLDRSSLAAAHEARAAGVRIAVRSALLQGVLTERSAADLPEHLAVLAPSLRALRELASQRGCSLSDLATRALLDDPRVDALLMGCDRVEQVHLAEAVRRSSPLTRPEVRAVEAAERPGTPATDPRTWP